MARGGGGELGGGMSLPPWLAQWRRGSDTGLSSRYLAAIFSGSEAHRRVTECAAPCDTDDVGRCIRLLDLAAANGCDWRSCLDDLISPAWAALVPHWPEIEAAFREDEAAQAAWTREMRGESKRATFPPSRCWWLVSTLQGHGDPYQDRRPHPFVEVTP